MASDLPRLYGFSLSHPTIAVRGMLEHKGIAYRSVNLLPGMHPVAVRALGFRRATVPAMRIDGKRVQGSLQISRYLDERTPEPPLFGTDPETRQAIEAAEAWGEAVLQPIPRRLFRWLATRDQSVRRWVAGEVVGMPAPGLMGRLQQPLANILRHIEGADDAAIEADLRALPAHLDHIDSLIETGTIGGPTPNAADFQISATVRTLMTFTDLAPLFTTGRPATALAERVVDAVPGPVPAALPPRLAELVRN